MKKITQKLTGVLTSKDAGQDVRDELKSKGNESLMNGNPHREFRYNTCSECPSLKEEFKLFGFTLKDKTPTCGECGCNLNIKIKTEFTDCPLGLW
jgi:hypothetical protein